MRTEDQIKTGFSDNLKIARSKIKLTDEEISETLLKQYGISLSPKQVNNHFNGISIPKLPTIYAYCELFDVPADFLLFGTGEMSANREKEEKTVSEIIDALATVLESFEMVIDLKEYEVEQTEFFPFRSKIVDNEIGIEEYQESAFSETKRSFYAIGINSSTVQELISAWARKEEVVSKVSRDREELTRLLFTNEVERAKKRYDSIDPYYCELFKKDDPPIFIDNSRGSVPYPLTGFGLNLHQEAFLRTQVETGETDSSGFPITREIPNRTRMLVLAKAGCTEQSLDKAISTGDLSELEYEY